MSQIAQMDEKEAFSVDIWAQQTLEGHTSTYTQTHARIYDHVSRACATLVMLRSGLLLHRADCTFTAITVHCHR